MDIRRVRTATLLLSLALGVSGAPAEEQVGTWLNKMAQAARSLSYDGIFVYQKNGQVDAMRLIRSVNGRGEHERLIALTGPARELVRDDTMVTCIVPSGKAPPIGIKRTRNPFLAMVPQHYKVLQQFYHFRLGEQDRIAGRITQQLIVEPKDHHRYGYHLWLDQESGLLLKSQVMDASDKSLEQMMFTSLEILDKVPPDLLRPGNSLGSQGEQMRWHITEQEPQDTNKSCWNVDWLPPGFSLVAHEMRRPSGSENALEHLVFTDGLALVSIFMEREPQPPVPVGVLQRGAVNTYTRRIGNTLVTVVGEIPALTVKQIGDSVNYVGNASP
jgi:sigma-E factor negative regulatory protein RseB